MREKNRVDPLLRKPVHRGIEARDPRQDEVGLRRLHGNEMAIVDRQDAQPVQRRSEDLGCDHGPLQGRVARLAGLQGGKPGWEFDVQAQLLAGGRGEKRRVQTRGRGGIGVGEQQDARAVRRLFDGLRRRFIARKCARPGSQRAIQSVIRGAGENQVRRAARPSRPGGGSHDRALAQ